MPGVKSGQPNGNKLLRVIASGIVAAQPAVLNHLIINGVGTGGTLTIYDSASGTTGTPPFVLPLAAATAPYEMHLEGNFANGIFASYDGTLVGGITFAFNTL